jgi:phage tail-like protein
MSKKIIYPPAGYNFAVAIAPSTSLIDSSFARISGIGMSRQTEEIIEGGGNNRHYRLPLGITFEPLVLERGFAYKNSAFGQWCYDTITMKGNAISTKQIIVHLLDHNPNSNGPLMSWAFFDCYPLKWRLSELNAKESVLAIETMELAYAYFSPVQ